MLWRRKIGLSLFVVFVVVVFESVEPLGASFLVDPELWEHVSDGCNSIQNPEFRRDLKLDTQVARGLYPGLSAAPFLDLSVVGTDMAFVNITKLFRLFLEDFGIVGEPDAGVFIEIDEPELSADMLKEPDRVPIIDTKVPDGMDPGHWLVGNVGNSAFFVGLHDLMGVIGAGDGDAKAAIIFLLE